MLQVDHSGVRCVARCDIQEGGLVIKEAPFISFCSTPDDYLCCSCCFLPLGCVCDHFTNLANIVGADVYEVEMLLGKIPQEIKEQSEIKEPTLRSPVFPCRNSCGVLYCSTKCEITSYENHHQLYCGTSEDIQDFCSQTSCETVWLAFQMLSYILICKRNNKIPNLYEQLNHKAWIDQTILENPPETKHEPTKTCGDDDCDDCDETEDLKINIEALHSSFELISGLYSKLFKELDYSFDFDSWNQILGTIDNYSLPMVAPSPTEEYLLRLKEFASCANCEDKQLVNDIVEKLLDIVEDVYDVPIEGFGLFEVINRISHSCTPNTILQHRDEDISGDAVLIALRDIREGEPITLCRAALEFDSFAQLSVDERHAILGFTCSCNICEQEQKTDHNWHFEMLHDTKRNAAYRKSIQNLITRIQQEKNEPVHVLDIGTGSGLLSLLAAEAGASFITAVECIPYISQLASQIITNNQRQDKIRVIPHKSTELTAEDVLWKKQEPNLIIAELMNFSLLGEQILPTLYHAQKNLTSNCQVIPSYAKVFGQLIESHFIASMSENMFLDDNSMRGDSKYEPIQYRNIKDAVYLSREFEALEIPFGREIQLCGEFSQTLDIVATGTCHAVVFWWKAILDSSNIEETTIDCSPGQGGHWTQSLFFFDSPVSLTIGDSISLLSMFNRTDISFKIKKSTPEKNLHGAGVNLSRTRIAALNDQMFWSSFTSCIKDILNDISSDETVEFLHTTLIDDETLKLHQTFEKALGSLSIGYQTSKVGLNTSYGTSEKLESRTGVKLLECIGEANSFDVTDDLLSQVFSIHQSNVIDSYKTSKAVHMLVAEPFFMNLIESHVLSSAFMFWWISRKFCSHLKLSSPNTRFMVAPNNAVLYAQLISFSSLCETTSPISAPVEGFDLTLFNQIHNRKLRAIPMYLHDFEEVSHEIEILRLDFSHSVDDAPFCMNFDVGLDKCVLNGIGEDRRCNGVICWAEYSMGTKIISHKPKSSSWRDCGSQLPAVYFLDKNELGISNLNRLSGSVDLASGNVEFSVS